jgi:rubrerythrin
MLKPFEEKPKKIEDTILDWEKLYPKPYDKHTADPWTKCRIILMNGIEVEATMFGHNFHRQCKDQDLRRELAMTRRIEQEQQKVINWLSPADESQLELTIGYEHVAVDLTAWLAQHEPDDYVVDCLNFALLEDFDHLYRYADLLKFDKDIAAHELVKKYVEITPGRPTISHYRHPFDAVKRPCDFKKADDRTKLNTMIITAGEQQTMNFYMNIGPTYENDPGRKLYQQIGMVEEQHVTHYGALLDPNCTWLENLLLHDYVECYLYYSFYESEVDDNVKKIWEIFLEQEIAHLHKAAELLEKYEGTQWQEVVTGEFPELLVFEDTKDYVRKVLKNEAELTAYEEDFFDVHKLPADNKFFDYQKKVGNDKLDQVESHMVIDRYQKKTGRLPL